MSWGVMGLEVWRKGPWTAEEDSLLTDYVNLHGEGRWNSVARLAGLKRNGKSCRLRWVNYLRPDLKRGQITPHEENIILELHARWGNRWSTIARNLPGRTDNEIKNYWRTHFKKKTKACSEKAKSRLFKRQQFQEQMQQQQQFDHQVDMRKVMCLMEESDNLNNSDKCSSWCVAPQQSYWSSMMNNVPEALNEEMGMWDQGWWNLDDSFNAKAAALHNFVTPLC